MKIFISSISILLSLCLLDYLRLGVIMKHQIQQRLWGLLRSPILLGPAIAFYVLYSIAIMVFVVLPTKNSGTIYHVLWYGAFLGFTAYMTYDLTNRATIKNRPVSMIVPDILRWTIVTALVATIWYLVYHNL